MKKPTDFYPCAIFAYFNTSSTCPHNGREGCWSCHRAQFDPVSGSFSKLRAMYTPSMESSCILLATKGKTHKTEGH